jgi:hypothetical protein
MTCVARRLSILPLLLACLLAVPRNVARCFIDCPPRVQSSLRLSV